MTAPVFLRRTLRGFEPASDASAEALRKIKLGDVVRADVRRPRNVKMHNRYWALVAFIWQNQSHFATMEDLHEAIKFRVGLVEPLRLPDGTEIQRAGSINFAAMDQTRFEAFWDKVCEYICRDVLPGVSRADLERELMQLVGVAA